MSAPQGTITQEEVAAIIGREKFLFGDVNWREMPANSVILHASFIVLDAEQKTIPSLTVELIYCEGRIKSECKYLFTLFALRPPRARVYQIEVVPPDKCSHRANGDNWYGPHQHFGEKAVKIEESKDLGCGDHEAWFKVFLRIAKISFSGRYLPPGSPQGDLKW